MYKYELNVHIELYKVLSISNHIKVQFTWLDVITITDEFIIFIEISIILSQNIIIKK